MTTPSGTGWESAVRSLDSLLLRCFAGFGWQDGEINYADAAGHRDPRQTAGLRFSRSSGQGFGDLSRQAADFENCSCRGGRQRYGNEFTFERESGRELRAFQNGGINCATFLRRFAQVIFVTCERVRISSEAGSEYPARSGKYIFRYRSWRNSFCS